MHRQTPRPLAEQLCFTLYSASIGINRLYKPMLDEKGITYPQYLVLNTLGEHDGASIGRIAEHLALESSTVTPLVKRLEQAGLVERRRSTSDERQVHVRLTARGLEILEDCKCLNDTLLARSGMTLAEIGELNRKMQAFMTAIGGEADQVPEA